MAQSRGPKEPSMVRFLNEVTGRGRSPSTRRIHHRGTFPTTPKNLKCLSREYLEKPVKWLNKGRPSTSSTWRPNQAARAPEFKSSMNGEIDWCCKIGLRRFPQQLRVRASCCLNKAPVSAPHRKAHACGLPRATACDSMAEGGKGVIQVNFYDALDDC